MDALLWVPERALDKAQLVQICPSVARQGSPLPLFSLGSVTFASHLPPASHTQSVSIV